MNIRGRPWMVALGLFAAGFAASGIMDQVLVIVYPPAPTISPAELWKVNLADPCAQSEFQSHQSDRLASQPPVGALRFRSGFQPFGRWWERRLPQPLPRSSDNQLHEV